jgi:hypothetical protein
MTDWNPFWTDTVQIENGGRYPLLLNRFHDHLEDLLIKGIVSTTDRLRYISYCCWAIGDIESSMNCQTYYEFEEAFRRRETALAVGAYLLQPETVVGNYAIYGIEGMKTRDIREDKENDCSFRILPSQPLGAFGQYYKGTLQNWGLIYVTEEGVIRLTALGKELYEIMDKHYQNNEYYLTYKGHKFVPGKVLKKWAEANEYDNITDSRHKAERDFYKKVLFHLDQKEQSDFRRDTLTIYLESIMECNKRQVEFNEDVLRNILYYGSMQVSNETVPISLSPSLEDAHFYWKMYELHVYFRWWISEYLWHFLDRLAGSPNGLTLQEVIVQINQEIFNQKTGEILTSKIDYYSLSFEDLFTIVNRAPDKSFLEDELSYTECENISHFSAYLLIMLALLYEKYHEMKEDNRYIFVRMRLIEDYWFDEFFRDLEMVKDYPIPELLAFILNRYVIQKHDIAMYAKHDLRRCWFTKFGEKYQFQAHSRSIWRPAKHRNICNFLFDMKLITFKDGFPEMTSEGNLLYNELKETIYHGE